MLSCTRHVERRRVRLEQEPDVLAEERIRLERGRAPPIRIGAIATFCSLKRPALVDRLQMLQVDEPVGSGGSLIEIAAVREHRRLVDAAEAAGLVDRAGEEREVLRQVRQMHARQLGLRLVARPLERAADDVEIRVGPVAHHAVALEQALHESVDDLRLLLGEAACGRSARRPRSAGCDSSSARAPGRRCRSRPRRPSAPTSRTRRAGSCRT